MGDCLISKWKEIFHFLRVWKGLGGLWKTFQTAYRGEGWVQKHMQRIGGVLNLSKATTISFHYEHYSIKN